MSKRKRVPFEFHPLKIDSKPGELPDFVATSSERPDFLRGDAGMGGGSIGPDDVVWIAPDADGQLEVRLPRQGYEQYSPFDRFSLPSSAPTQREGMNTSDWFTRPPPQRVTTCYARSQHVGPRRWGAVPMSSILACARKSRSLGRPATKV